MIDVELLKKVRTIVTHEGCADGVASALILKDALPDARVVFVQYGTIKWHDLPIEPGMLFCDMTPPPEHADGFNEVGKSIVLDHHRGARELVAKFGDRGVFADEEEEPGVSGALLAFTEVWFPLRSKDQDASTGLYGRVLTLAELAGIRDTWQRTSFRWKEACAQAAALRFWPWEDLAAQFGFQDTFADLMRVGPVLIKKNAEQVRRSIREAYRFNVCGLRVAAFEGQHTSDVADALDGECDLVLGWHYSCESVGKMIVSCRSRGRLTALELAERHGGGGHERAAGFTLWLGTQPAYDPYATIEALVREAVQT